MGQRNLYNFYILGPVSTTPKTYFRRNFCFSALVKCESLSRKPNVNCLPMSKQEEWNADPPQSPSRGEQIREQWDAMR